MVFSVGAVTLALFMAKLLVGFEQFSAVATVEKRRQIVAPIAILWRLLLIPAATTKLPAHRVKGRRRSGLSGLIGLFGPCFSRASMDDPSRLA